MQGENHHHTYLGTFAKGITLAVFLFLVGLFIAFKAGVWQSNPDEGDLNDVSLSSSKSSILMDNNNLSSLAQVDSEKVITDTVAIPETNENEIPRTMFSGQNYATSSKSMVVLKPGDVFYIKQMSFFEKFGLPEPFSPHKPFIIDTVTLLKPAR